MNVPPPEQPAGLETRSFVLLMAIVTLAFGMILLPFWGAVFWGVIIAILSAPLQRVLVRRMGGSRTWAALATLAIILLIVTPPLVLIAASLVKEGSAAYGRMNSGDLNFGRYFQEMVAALPSWFTQLLDRFGIGNCDSVENGFWMNTPIEFRVAPEPLLLLTPIGRVRVPERSVMRWSQR